MVAFDASGNARWMVPNEIPQIATADGGVIGQSGITYDKNGNATGQTILAVPSWNFNSYEDGELSQYIIIQPFTPSAMPLLKAGTRIWLGHL